MQSINAPQNVVYIYKYSCQNMLSSNSSQIYPPTKSSIFFTFKNTRNQNNPILINTHFPTFQIIPALQATKMPKSFTRFPSSERNNLWQNPETKTNTTTSTKHENSKTTTIHTKSERSIRIKYFFSIIPKRKKIIL